MQDNQAAKRGGGNSAAQSEEHAGEDEGPVRTAYETGHHGAGRQENASANHRWRVSEVCLASEQCLCEEAGEKPGASNHAQLRVRKAEGVSQVRQEGVDG